MKKVIIIAEIGECWNGDKEQAKMLIKNAALSGCDYVKFQTLDPDTVRSNDPERDWFLKVSLNDKMIDFIISLAHKNKIKPLFSPANAKKAKVLKEKFNLNEVKVASSVFHNREAVKYIAKNYKRVFLSTGMSSLSEIRSITSLFNKKNNELYLLHCISEYPTGPLLKERGLVSLAEEDVHLNMMLILKKLFPHYRIGYSDHSAGLLVPVCAVAAGAEVIEKHITLDRRRPVRLYNSTRGYLGTDHIFSLEPNELKQMVKQIRHVERIFGDLTWKRTKGEKTLKKFLVGRF